MANVIAAVQKPTLVIAHNKTLAAQLCNEFREFLPDNAVEYFVSYYDYYQPEAYVPAQDLYIEKDSSINDEIDRLRHAATSALFLRRDVVIVASVSCIFGLGSPDEYLESMVLLQVGEQVDRDETAAQAGRHPVRAQRLRARARQVPRARRLAGDLAGQRGHGPARHAVGRRGRGRSPVSTRWAARCSRSCRTWPSTRPPTSSPASRPSSVPWSRSSASSTSAAPGSRSTASRSSRTVSGSARCTTWR